MPDNPPNNSPFEDVPVQLTVSVGHARPTIGQLMSLKQDSVLTLDRAITDPVEIFIGDKLVATGILEETGDGDSRQLAVRLTDVPGLANEK